jgi:hypothetical protein
MMLDPGAVTVPNVVMVAARALVWPANEIVETATAVRTALCMRIVAPFAMC